MNELIKITENNGKKAVSARELYEHLGFKDNNFTKFCNRYIIKNEYALQCTDYEHLVHMDDLPNGGFRETKDYALTIDLAKKICMLARTEQGEKIRNYFIEAEKTLTTIRSEVKQLSHSEILLQAIQIQVEQEKKLNLIEDRVAHIETQTKTMPDYFTIIGYATLKHIKISLNTAATVGKKAAAICKRQGMSMGDLPDPRFGRVHTYPTEVLDLVFSQSYTF